MVISIINPQTGVVLVLVLGPMCHFRTQIMFAHSSGGNGPVSDRKSLVLEGFLRIDYSRVVRDFGGSPYERNSKRRPVAASADD